MNPYQSPNNVETDPRAFLHSESLSSEIILSIIVIIIDSSLCVRIYLDYIKDTWNYIDTVFYTTIGTIIIVHLTAVIYIFILSMYRYKCRIMTKLKSVPMSKNNR